MKLAGFVGFGDINFESAEFSKTFHVSCSDRKFAYDVIDPRMMEFLLQSDPATVDIEHGRMCLSDGSTRWSPEQFKGQLDWTRAFFNHWPNHVKVDLKSQATQV